MTEDNESTETQDNNEAKVFDPKSIVEFFMKPMNAAIAGGSALVVTCLIGGHIYGSGVAKDRLDKMLEDAGIRGAVKYQDVSYNPLGGALSISGIKFQDFKLDEFVVHDYHFDDEDDELMVELEFDGENITVAELPNDMRKVLQKVGIKTTDVTGELYFDLDEGEIQFEFVIHLDGLAEVNFSTELTYDGKLADLFASGAIGAMMGMHSYFDDFSVVNLELHLEDDGFMAAVKDSNDFEEPSDTEIKRLAEDAVRYFGLANKKSDEYAEMVDSITDVIEDLDELHVEIDPDSPVTISKLIKYALQEKLAAKANVSVSS